MRNRILYFQYTNPAAYPPLLNSSRILADIGWEVCVLGTGAQGQANSLNFPEHPNITVRRWHFRRSGIAQKLHFLGFNFWIVKTALFWRPQWIYASELLACPAALALNSLGFHVVYHEHDNPRAIENRRQSDFSLLQKFLMWTRKKLAQRTDLCVLPNVKRMNLFREETGRRAPTLCVWNCPMRDEAKTTNQSNERFTLHYHGNIGPDLLPMNLLDAIRDLPSAYLRVIGYTTSGNDDYPRAFSERAMELGVADRVQVLGPLNRSELFAAARSATVGWAVVPSKSNNINLQTMTGASNKPFDYMACGLALLVATVPEWTETFVENGFGRACDPINAASIGSEIAWFLEHRAQTSSMGETGRRQIEDRWNYETQFEKVLAYLEHGDSSKLQ